MSTVAILQARTTSSRLPGKVLEPLAGAPMILRQLERIARATTVDDIIVATSSDPSDDELARVVESAGFRVVRGSLTDVLGRFVSALDAYERAMPEPIGAPPTAVVRLTADCPLTDPAVIDLVVEEFHASGADYCSNTMTPTYPDGLDVEVVKSTVLRSVDQETSDPDEREHVTLGVYRRHDRFRIENVSGADDLSYLRWTVDTPEDLVFVRAVYGALYADNPNFGLEEVLDLLQRNPRLSRTTRDAPRNAALEGLDTGAMNA